MPPLPAHQTKHVKELVYDLYPLERSIILHQDDTVEQSSTGRTAWLGGQVLCVYLQTILKGESNGVKRKRVIDVGAGTGLLSLSLHHSGYDVISTDVSLITKGILRKNLLQNQSTYLDAPLLQARTLDWFSKPIEWNWNRSSISPLSNEDVLEETEELGLLSPPFDFIVTSDSIYHPSLSQPLLRTLHGLSLPLNSSSNTSEPLTESFSKTKKASIPPIYLALENRDPPLISAFLTSARDDWGFKTTQVVKERLEKLLGKGKGGFGWEEEDWDGVELWVLKWNGTGSGPMVEE